MNIGGWTHAQCASCASTKYARDQYMRFRSDRVATSHTHTHTGTRTVYACNATIHLSHKQIVCIVSEWAKVAIGKLARARASRLARNTRLVRQRRCREREHYRYPRSRFIVAFLPPPIPLLLLHIGRTTNRPSLCSMISLATCTMDSTDGSRRYTMKF